MDAFDVAQISSVYSRGAKLIPKDGSVQNLQPSSSRSGTRAYTLTLSPKATEQARNLFEIRQLREAQSFESSQKRESAAKDRELAAEKSRFDREQVADERQFKEKQRIDKIRYNQQPDVRA